MCSGTQVRRSSSGLAGAMDLVANLNVGGMEGASSNENCSGAADDMQGQKTQERGCASCTVSYRYLAVIYNSLLPSSLPAICSDQAYRKRESNGRGENSHVLPWKFPDVVLAVQHPVHKTSPKVVS
jgi:hypothetical protein